MSPLIGILVVGLGLAFVMGTAAQRLKLPPLVGYLLAGVMIGPFTPGFVADTNLALQLADVGVILLMFGVGLHFKPRDLLEVKGIVIPGAILQMAAITGLGFGASMLLGWPLAQGLVFGLCLSVASTVVVMRALQDRRLMETGRGKVAIGWLVVQDLLVVLVLVLLPPIAAVLKGGDINMMVLAKSLGLTFGKLPDVDALGRHRAQSFLKSCALGRSRCEARDRLVDGGRRAEDSRSAHAAIVLSAACA